MKDSNDLKIYITSFPARVGEVVEINRKFCCGMMTHVDVLTYTKDGWSTRNNNLITINDRLSIRLIKLLIKNRQRGGRFVGDSLWPNYNLK